MIGEYAGEAIYRGAVAVARAIDGILLGVMAEGIVATGFPQHSPRSHDQRPAEPGTIVQTVATGVGPLVAETLVNRTPPSPTPQWHV